MFAGEGVHWCVLCLSPVFEVVFLNVGKKKDVVKETLLELFP